MATRSPLAIALLLPALATLPAAPATAEITCQGRPATIVGDPAEPTVGTPGPDVIVSNGSKVVDARGGADRVCLTTGTYYRLFTGAGDDVVTMDDAGYSDAEIDLGTGDDTLTSGAGADLVDGGGGDDTIVTGDGDDEVTVGAATGTPDTAVVDTGSGDDRVVLRPVGLTGDGSMVAGPGDDELRLLHTRLPDGPTVLDVDVPHRRVTRDGAVQLDGWSGFEAYRTDERSFHAVGGLALTFTGSIASERLETSASDLDVDTRGGDDEIALTVSQGTTGVLVGASGRDRVVVLEGGRRAPAVSLDLSRGRLARLHDARAVVRLYGLEDAAVRRGGGVLVGDRRANRLQSLCGTVRGLGGADVVRQGTVVHESTRPLFFRPTTCPDDDRFRAEGGAGDDRLYGSYSPDVLLGGPGRDLAEGRAGRDRCEAERRVTCEA
jgi:Ca2+-binding RTX toxin-like protein